jgi:hypothetical protein
MISGASCSTSGEPMFDLHNRMRVAHPSLHAMRSESSAVWVYIGGSKAESESETVGPRPRYISYQPAMHEADEANRPWLPLGCHNSVMTMMIMTKRHPGPSP